MQLLGPSHVRVVAGITFGVSEGVRPDLPFVVSWQKGNRAKTVRWYLSPRPLATAANPNTGESPEGARPLVPAVPSPPTGSQLVLPQGNL